MDTNLPILHQISSRDCRILQRPTLNGRHVLNISDSQWPHLGGGVDGVEATFPNAGLSGRLVLIPTKTFTREWFKCYTNLYRRLSVVSAFRPNLRLFLGPTMEVTAVGKMHWNEWILLLRIREHTGTDLVVPALIGGQQCRSTDWHGRRCIGRRMLKNEKKYKNIFIE